LLYLTFEPSQSAFKRLAILKMDFCQLKIHLPFTTKLQYTVNLETASPLATLGIAWK
jgi:hypothetical protein